jgi:rhodanese-related sulfurtransferase
MGSFSMNTTTKAISLLLFVAVIGGGIRWWQHRGVASKKKAAETALFGSTLEAIKSAKLLIINVNDKEEFDDAHIAGGKGIVSIYVPFTEIGKAIELFDKNMPIVTYCSNYFCSACHTAAIRLTEAGFTSVKVFSGGIAEWYQLAQQDAGKYRFDGPAQRPYLKIHVNKPASSDEKLTIISAQELQKLIEDITIS